MSQNFCPRVLIFSKIVEITYDYVDLKMIDLENFWSQGAIERKMTPELRLITLIQYSLYIQSICMMLYENLLA